VQRCCCPAGRPGRELCAVTAANCTLGGPLIDGGAAACNDDGLSVFDRLRYRRQNGWVFLYAFDLLELDGDDLRREPIERRKVLLIRLLAKAPVGLQVSDHIVEPGDMVTCLSTWFRGYRIEAATTMSLPARLSDRLGRAVRAFSIA
jgi:hypothetical protein